MIQNAKSLEHLVSISDGCGISENVYRCAEKYKNDQNFKCLLNTSTYFENIFHKKTISHQSSYKNHPYCI